MRSSLNLVVAVLVAATLGACGGGGGGGGGGPGDVPGAGNGQGPSGPGESLGSPTLVAGPPNGTAVPALEPAPVPPTPRTYVASGGFQGGTWIPVGPGWFPAGEAPVRSVVVPTGEPQVPNQGPVPTPALPPRSIPIPTQPGRSLVSVASAGPVPPGPGLPPNLTPPHRELGSENTFGASTIVGSGTPLQPVPEPETVVLYAMGIAAAAYVAWRRMYRQARPVAVGSE